MLATYSIFLEQLGLLLCKSVRVDKNKLDILMKDDILTMIISIESLGQGGFGADRSSRLP